MAKSRRKAKPKSRETKAQTAWRVVASRASTLVFCAVVVALGLAWVLGQGALRRSVAIARAEPVSLRIAWPTVAGDRSRTWMPESVRREIEQTALSRISPDVFDRESLEQARAALEATGWFERVDAVRRLEGNLIEIQGVWRTPLAVVRQDNRDIVVGAGGALLPLSYAPGGAGPGLKVIRGVSQRPPIRADGSPAYGAAWPGGEVQAGLDLLDALRRAFSATRVWPQITGVDAAMFQRDGRLAIVSDQDSRIVWGAPPGMIAPGEQSTDQKIARLVHLANGPTERIDAGERWIEIYSAHVYVDRSHSPGAVAQGETP